MDVSNEVKAAMQAVLEHIKNELKAIRTGRANTALLDSVTVEVYGTQMRLRDIANITVPEPRQLLITPFDPHNSAFIAKGIEAANLNVQAIVNGNVVRVNIPPMDESLRREMAKQCKKRGEEAKVAVREVRKKFNDKVKKLKQDGDLSEDEVKRQEKIIQEQTDHFCKEVDVLCEKKEKEILEI